MSTIFKNGRFFTPDADARQGFLEREECMVIENDLVTHMGLVSHRVVEEAREQSAHEIDLRDQVVVPGFIDAHCHISMLGASLNRVDLRYCKTLEEIRVKISDYATNNPSTPMILCRGWIQGTTDGKALASMLDGIDSRPIFIEANDLHSAWCSAAALEALELEGRPDPRGGHIHRDNVGKASGLLSEAAQVEIVWPYIAQCTPREEKINNIVTALDAYRVAGYTGLIDMAMGEEDWEILQELDSQGKLQCWIRAHWLIKPREKTEDNSAQVDRAIELSLQTAKETFPNLQIAGIKFICDGVVDGCTASLMEPYTSNHISCDPIWTEDMLTPVVEHADKAGLQCAFHAIGDRTIKTVVDVIEKCGSPGRRHRIEHLEVTRPEDAKRLGRLGITASVQPVHSDPAILTAWPKLLGEHRCKRGFAYKEFADHGATLALGTDAPTAPYSALENLYIAMTRRSAMEPELTATTNKEFALSMAAAFTGVTRGGAYSCFLEDRTGALTTGSRADFMVLELEGAPEGLMKGKVSQTWSKGKKIFDSQSNHD